jgi:cell division septum initiation protein DivIVA
VEVYDRLDELTEAVEQARTVPLSSGGCVVNRQQVLELLDAIRANIPGDVEQAHAILDERIDVIEDGQREADRIVNEAKLEAARLIDENVLLTQARAQASEIVNSAADDADHMRAETADWVDAKLAQFEVSLTRILDAVQKGRDRVSGSHPYDALSPDGRD